jgi:hypothetical protein
VRRFFFLLAVVAVALVGCGPREMPTVAVYPVKGKILLGSTPLSGGRLTLTPVDVKLYGPAEATADVQPDGTFEPMAVGGQSGLMPGKWKVVVSPIGYKEGKPYRIKEGVPPRYQKEETTDLVIEVAQGENNPTVTLRP